MARTAVVAGTATVVAGGVAGKQQQKAQAQAAAAQSQQQLADMQAQMTELQAQQAAAAMPASPAVPTGAGADLMSQLEKLAEMKGAGLLSEEEFQAAKQRLLAS
jgi:hypothetical protein